MILIRVPEFTKANRLSRVRNILAYYFGARRATRKPVLKLMMALDKHSCQKSDLVITVGRDLTDNLKVRFAGKQIPKYKLINNWIDEKTTYSISSEDSMVRAFKENHGLSDKFVVMYSGNMGLYYDLDGTSWLRKNQALTYLLI